jgi:hypothetical protein
MLGPPVVGPPVRVSNRRFGSIAGFQAGRLGHRYFGLIDDTQTDPLPNFRSI